MEHAMLAGQTRPVEQVTLVDWEQASSGSASNASALRGTET
jgi:hypothetical protein